MIGFFETFRKNVVENILLKSLRCNAAVEEEAAVDDAAVEAAVDAAAHGGNCVCVQSFNEFRHVVVEQRRLAMSMNNYVFESTALEFKEFAEHSFFFQLKDDTK